MTLCRTDGVRGRNDFIPRSTLLMANPTMIVHGEESQWPSLDSRLLTTSAPSEDCVSHAFPAPEERCSFVEENASG